MTCDPEPDLYYKGQRKNAIGGKKMLSCFDAKGLFSALALIMKKVWNSSFLSGKKKFETKHFKLYKREQRLKSLKI